METLIATINKLQDVFHSINLPNSIDLPQIVVIGSQSSGKSSVLENIVGRDFLPRGTGIVTRRPLVLQLVNTQRKESGAKQETEEYGEFLHLPGQVFHDFKAIRDEIVRDTDAKTGTNKGVSPLPINLKVFSPHVLNLTLVDLPGMTKVPVGGQPADIEVQIRKMCLQYVSKKNAIILAVTAANTDLANSDALNLAKQVDPTGERTIGVLTKIDIMDEGTHVLDILAGRVIPLRLGYVPVVNRGQKDIDANKVIRDALEYEKNFFENHPAYATKAQYCGTPFLARKLNMILMHHIREVLPELKIKISQLLAKYRLELSELGDNMAENEASWNNLLLTTITEFSSEYRTILDGYSENLSSQELAGGARISFVFHEIFANGIRDVDPFDQIQDADIRTILYNSSGSSPSLFVSPQSFEVLIRQQIRRLEEPSAQCVILVFDELMRILTQLEQRKVFKRFPILKERLHAAVVAFLRKLLDPTNKLVGDVLKAESNYINTAHPDFLTGHRAISMVNERLFGNMSAPPTPQPPQTKSGMPLPMAQAQPGGAPAPAMVAAVPSSAGLYVPASAADNSGFFNSFFGSGKARPKPVSAPNPNGPVKLEQPPAALRATGNLSEREVMEIEVIKLLLESYFSIVKRTVSDMVPKAIMLHLVNYSKENLQRELLNELYKAKWDDALKESDHVTAKRAECKRMIEVLASAETAVSAV